MSNVAIKPLINYKNVFEILHHLFEEQVYTNFSDVEIPTSGLMSSRYCAAIDRAIEQCKEPYYNWSSLIQELNDKRQVFYPDFDGQNIYTFYLQSNKQKFLTIIEKAAAAENERLLDLPTTGINIFAKLLDILDDPSTCFDHSWNNKIEIKISKETVAKFKLFSYGSFLTNPNWGHEVHSVLNTLNNSTYNTDRLTSDCINNTLITAIKEFISDFKISTDKYYFDSLKEIFYTLPQDLDLLRNVLIKASEIRENDKNTNQTV